MRKITKKYEIKGSLDEVLKALTREDLIEQWSFSEALMDIRPGGEFSLWGGDIHGINQEITRNKIVQDWKEKGWPNFSKVTFMLNEGDGITTVELVHEGIPENSFKSINEGWDEYYLGPLKDMVEGLDREEEEF